jgi:hypothetical protein
VTYLLRQHIRFAFCHQTRARLSFMPCTFLQVRRQHAQPKPLFRERAGELAIPSGPREETTDEFAHGCALAYNFDLTSPVRFNDQSTKPPGSDHIAPSRRAARFRALMLGSAYDFGPFHPSHSQRQFDFQ